MQLTKNRVASVAWQSAFHLELTSDWQTVNIYNRQDSSQNIWIFKIIINNSKKYKNFYKRNKDGRKKLKDKKSDWQYSNKITKLLKINWSKLIQR
jgi:hypothetical protein